MSSIFRVGVLVFASYGSVKAGIWGNSYDSQEAIQLAKYGIPREIKYKEQTHPNVRASYYNVTVFKT